jgi:hypothetical protein
VTEDPKEEIRRVDEALRIWRQGDCIVGEHWFVHRFTPALPLTEEAAKIAADVEAAGVDLAESEVRGLMIASQSCDVVRSCAERPFVEVCPLVDLEDDVLKEVERGRRPQLAYVPGVAPRRLAADLDRVMTIEKSIVATWERTPGCEDDPARRRLAAALARKRVRFAFPDDFVEMVTKLLKRLQSKHDKDSDEGRALRALREIRVRAAPSWNADQVEITFWFIPESDDIDFEGRGWNEYLEAWRKLAVPAGRFVKIDGVVRPLDDLSARDYVESDPLDLDHLSIRED